MSEHDVVMNEEMSKVGKHSYLRELAPCPQDLLLRVRVRITLRLVVYRQSVRLDDNPLVTHDQQSFSTEKLSVIALM
jgi:hypothetical protein